METGRSRGYRDHSQLPPLTLGLSSVRLIVNRLEAEYASAFASTTEHQLVRYNPTGDGDHDTPLDSSKGRALYRFLVNLAHSLSRCIPSVSFGNFGILAVLVGFIAPKMISYLVLYPFCRLVFGTLYPAYASYKAVRTKNLKEYVKWMMYWIVFALFTCTETFTDVFLSWFPFYYEVKIVLVLWLLSPATKGSSILYRKFVHPALCRREQEIDEYIAKAKDQGYHTVLNLGTKGVNYATTVIMQTAIKGGGGLVQQIRKSYSLSDLSECAPRDERDEASDVLAEPQLVRRNVVRSGYNTRRSASESNSRSPIYFPEVDVDIRNARTRVDEPDYSHIKSSEDISSGYSSADNSGTSLTRTASVGASARVKARQSTRTQMTAIKRPQPAEESEVIIEELREDDPFDYTSMPPLMNVPSSLFLSHSDPPFIYQYVGDQVKIIQILGDPLNARARTKNDIRVHKESLNDVLEQTGITEVKFDDQNLMIDVAKENSKKENTDTDDIFFESTDQTESCEFIDSIKNTNISQELDEKNYVKTVDNPQLSIPNISEDTDRSKTDVELTVVDAIPIIVTESDKKPIEPSKDDNKDSISLDTMLNENDTADSDDEASFGTPDNSPKTKRKSLKGRYGKGKAPPPPKADNKNKDEIETNDVSSLTTSQESLIDMMNTLPKAALKDTGSTSSLTVNPIAEKKRRHKSKSPNRMPKGTAIGKLLQLPGKLAFWHKNDNKCKDDNVSDLSDHSRRSSEKYDDYSKLNNESTLEDLGKADDQISFKDASDFESEVRAQDIMEKSDALQKLIEAKIESHPEYKYSTNTVEAETMTSYKSTDV